MDYDSDEDMDYQHPVNPPHHAGLGGFMAGMMGGMGPMGGMGMYGGPMGGRAPPGLFNQQYRAYSVAIHEIQQGRGNAGAQMSDGGRSNVMHGGQIFMPPSALRFLTERDIEGPWTFELRNPRKQGVSTHAGVLEFTADENTVHLPQWMMTRLGLQEGDPIRVNGTTLPKGKFTKLQAQSVTFLELADPKAVLEQALRAYTALTAGDIIEISYNMMVFSLLVMEVKPDVGAHGIMVLNTDLEVDFAPPVGYVEPERVFKPTRPESTMKDKFKINLGDTQDVDAKGKGSGRSTPTGAAWEAFKGTGFSVGGKKVKGRGSAKKIEEVDPDSKIIRTSAPRIITSDTQIGGRRVPAALNLPDGVLFFGFNMTKPEDPNEKKKPTESFSGQGTTLSGRKPK